MIEESLENAQPTPLISVIVPVFEEEKVIRPFLERIEPILETLGSYEVLFCVDPGTDDTVSVIENEAERNPRIGFLLFSRRFGQPAATMAGILNCSGDNCVVIDVDLQDPPEVILEMYAKVKEGYEVVYAQRRSRTGETLPKLAVSAVGYRLIDAISEVHIPRDTGDFRILTRRVIEELRQLNESHGFLRGMVAFVGFRQASLPYDRQERVGGRSKYNPFWGSLKIGFNGIIAYSTRLLSLTLLVGVMIAGVSFALAIMMIGLRLFTDFPYPLGIPTITALVLFLGGVQLIAVGIVGEYVARIYQEVRRRPLFILERAKNVRIQDAGQRV